MAHSIITRPDRQHWTFNNGSAGARTLSIGSSWTRLRLCVQMGCTHSSTIGSTPRWVIGLCSGTTNIYPGNCHFLGIRSNSSANWTIQTNHFSSWINTGVTHRHEFIQKVGASQTTISSTNNTVAGHLYRASSNNSMVYGMEIEKTTPTSWTLAAFSRCDSATTSQLEPQHAANVAFCGWGQVTALAGNGHQYFRTGETATVDETTNGVLDSVNLYWSHASASMEIMNIYAIKFA